MATRYLTVRSKLALVFFSTCALTFGVGGSLVSRSVSDTLEEEILTRLEFQSRAYANALDGQLSMLARRAEDFASDGFVRDASEGLLAASQDSSSTVADASGLRAPLRTHLLRNKLPLVDAFEDLQVISPGGELLLAAHKPPPSEVLHWLAAEPGGNGVRFSRLIAPEEPLGQTHMALAAPMVNRDGSRSLGWLVAWVNPSAWIFGALGSSAPEMENAKGACRRIHLLDRSGSRLTLQRSLFGDDLPAPASEHARSGFGLVYNAGDADPQERTEAPLPSGHHLRSFPLSSNGWMLEVESSTDEALAAVAGLQGRIFGIGLLVAAAACVLFLLPMRIVMRPLLQLSDAARKVAAGDESPSLAIDSKDELGEVGQAFVAMTQAVRERTRLQELTAGDLRKRQGELKAERDRLKAVIGSMQHGLIVLDPDSRPVVFNQASEPVLMALQNNEPEITSHHLCERGSSSSDACQACLFDPSRAQNACQVEIEGRTFEIHASPLPPDVDGRVGRVLVIHDFTNRINQDERMIHQERLAVLGEVAAVMAHELNNPLAAISMYNQMLSRELAEAPSLLENTAVIQRNVESCTRAIRELLDYATGATPEVDTVDLGAVLEDVAAFTRPLRERAEVELIINMPEQPLVAWGDELQIRQIFVNLIVNAIQAMAPEGGTVTIDAGLRGKRALITISDTGPGISPEAQGEIFRPFFTTKGRGKGTGLGLSTARRIAEMHGGGVELLQTSKEGSVFRVRLMQQEVLAV